MGWSDSPAITHTLHIPYACPSASALTTGYTSGVMSTTNVELNMAFFWICPECGVDNFERGVFWESNGCGAGEGANNYMLAPGEVTCADCDQAFEVIGEELELAD